MSQLERSQRPVWLGTDERQWDHIRIHLDVLKDPRLGANEIAAYAGLCAHAELHSGICFPALDTIASYMGAHWRTAHRAINVLRDCGYVRIEHKSGKASVYTLLDPKKAAGELSPPLTETAGVVIPTPDRNSRGPLTQNARTPDTDRDEQEPVTRSNNEVGGTNPTSSVGGVCPICDDYGWIEDEQGIAHRCSCDHRALRPSDNLASGDPSPPPR